jgi:pyruvate dehydrogenase E2 component (dihydrolipoamide acetyltransferase)
LATTSAIDVIMPQMGVSVSEGTITKWLKQVGEPVAADESLLEISTDKVDTEVPSPGEGILQQILVQEGETVDVGTKLAVIAPEGAEVEETGPVPEEAPPEPATAQAAAEAEAPSSSEGETPTAETVEDAAPAPPAATPAPAPVQTDGTGEKTFVSPVVARIASEHGVDVNQVSGTGRGGRVTKKDILAFVESGAQAPAPPPQEEAPAPAAEAPAPPAEPAPPPPPPAEAPAPPAEPAPPPPPPAEAPAPPAEPAPPPPPPAEPAAAPAPPPTPSPQPAPVAEAGQPDTGESFEPMNAMRRGIAEHMRRSLDTSAHVTSAIEVDMSKVVAIRKKLKKEYQQSYGVNPTYLAFVARGVVETLRDYPWINGELRGDQIVTRNYVNLGFAVELADGKGLIVPVIRHAEGLNLLGMARAVSEIAARAREKKLLPDDVQGGTFTITNPGGYGTFHGTPVISQPQAAILGTYAVVKRPWVVQDELGEDVIAIRPIMNLTLTYDHRLVDGALAGRFLRDLRERLESWDESNY